MTDKFDFYDVMATLVPGILIVALIGSLFPSLRDHLAFGREGVFTAMALTALSIFAGQALVAAGSILEPLLYRSWGGRPSDVALAGGLGPRYLPKTKARAIRSALAAECEPDAGDVSLFIKAMSMANAAAGSRVDRFNGLYAYHRTLLVLVLSAFTLVVVSRFGGSAQGWSVAGFSLALALLCGLAALCWHRARQRAYYFVREVLMTAERELARKTAS